MPRLKMNPAGISLLKGFCQADWDVTGNMRQDRCCNTSHTAAGGEEMLISIILRYGNSLKKFVSTGSRILIKREPGLDAYGQNHGIELREATNYCE